MARTLSKTVQRELQAAVDQKAEVFTAERQTLLATIGDEKQLEYWQSQSARTHLIRLGPVYRDRATIRVRAINQSDYQEIFYNLKTDERAHCELIVKPAFDSAWIETKFPWVWFFCRHKAAEAMLAVRDLHKQHIKKVRRENLTRPTKTKADA